MKVLVADRNATLLAAIAATFGRHFEIATVASRGECIGLLEQRKFDLVVACDVLADYTGLELLSELARESPRTLKIFAATQSRLKQLEDQLSLYGLFRTLSYPIDPRKLLSALKFARDHLPTETLPPNIRHVVLQDEWTTETGTWIPEQFSLPESGKPQPAKPQPAVAAGMTPKLPASRAAAVPTASQSEAFQRALAKRSAAQAEAALGNRMRAGPPGRGTQPPTRTPTPVESPQGTSSAFGSLSELARMATAPSSRHFVETGHRSRRAVFLLGAGVAVALGVAALSFELLGTSHSAARSANASPRHTPLFGPPPSHFVTGPANAAESASDGEHFTPAAATGLPTAPAEAQPQPVDPDRAPPEQPPPPAFERPGPMEPPSALSRAPTPEGSE
jgi:CheY-like chemotaxis protein